MKRLANFPIANLQSTFYMPQGQFPGLLIYLRFTSGAGVQLTRAILSQCTVQFNWNGEPIWMSDLDVINQLNNVYGGNAEFVQNIAGDNRAFIYLPFGLWTDSQHVYDFTAQDRASVTLDWSAAAAIAVTGNISLFAKPQIGVHSYFHKFIQRRISATGAGVIPDNYYLNNISQVYLKDPATSNVTDVYLSKNADVIVNAPIEVLSAYSAYIHVLETAVTMFAIDMGESKDVRENVGSTMEWEYRFSGAGVLDQYLSYISFTPAKEAESRINATNKLKNNIQRAAQ